MRTGLAALPALLAVTMLAGCTGIANVAKPDKPLEVCLGGTCGPAAGRFSRDQLVASLLVMMKANENSEAKLCETDAKTGACNRDFLSFFVQGGPIPGVSTYGAPYISQVGLDKASYQIKFQASGSVRWMATPVFCQDQYTVITVTEALDVTLESPGFACTWTALPMVWTMKFAVARIDLDNSVMAGNYATGGAGVLIAGGGDGTFEMRLAKTGTLLAGAERASKPALPGIAQLPADILAAPAPRAEDIAQVPKSQGIIDPEERKAWENAARANTPEAYRQYIRAYPNGRFTAAAAAKLEAAEEAERQNREIAHWERIKASTDPAEFDRFLAAYPKGLFADLASIRSRLLRAATADSKEQQAELAAWERVRGSSSAAELDAFLRQYPGGQFASAARERINRLAAQSNDLEMSMWEGIKASREPDDFRRYLKAFPKGLFAAAAAARLDAMATGDELAEWDRVRAGGNPDQLDAFAARHGNSPFAGLARQLATQLRSAATEKSESNAWERVRLSPNIADIDQFLSAHPNGRFAEAARLRRLEVVRRQAQRQGGSPHLAERPAPFVFPKVAERPDDVAVIIGNADYGRLGKNIPDVRPAHADAEGMKVYAIQALGIKEGNIILLKDATSAQMTRVFGSDKDHRGQLFDWIKGGKNRVFVYYSGHGAPGSQSGSPYLIPSDADAARIELNGYPVKQLYNNLAQIPAETITVVLEACFSGVSPAGSVLGKASPVFFDVKPPPVPANLTVITAGAANQVASWEPDDSHGLFTRHFLEGMSGKADIDRNGRVTLDELDRYLKESLTYFARRHYGRDQNAQIVKGGGR